MRKNECDQCFTLIQCTPLQWCDKGSDNDQMEKLISSILGVRFRNLQYDYTNWALFLRGPFLKGLSTYQNVINRSGDRSTYTWNQKIHFWWKCKMRTNAATVEIFCTASSLAQLREDKSSFFLVQRLYLNELPFLSLLPTRNAKMESRPVRRAAMVKWKIVWLFLSEN